MKFFILLALIMLAVSPVYSQSDTLFATQVDIFSNSQLQVISGDTAVGYLNTGSYFIWENVDFGTGVDSVDIRLVAHPNYISQFIVTIDGLDGDTILIYTPTTTGDWYTYEIQSYGLEPGYKIGESYSISGTHDLYVQSSGTASGNIHWMVFYGDDVERTEIQLKWNASTDNIGVAGYNIWLDTEYYGTTPDTTFSIILSEGIYNLAVSAFDAAGNESERSETLTVTVESVVPPTIPEDLILVFPFDFF